MTKKRQKVVKINLFQNVIGGAPFLIMGLSRGLIPSIWRDLGAVFLDTSERQRNKKINCRNAVDPPKMDYFSRKLLKTLCNLTPTKWRFWSQFRRFWRDLGAEFLDKKICTKNLEKLRNIKKNDHFFEKIPPP